MARATQAASPPDRAATFLSCDWGSSTLRLQLVRRANATVLAAVRCDRGASTLAATDDPTVRARVFGRALTATLAELARNDPAAATAQPIVLSGMVTSAHGWRELPYAQAPCALDGSGFVTETGTFRWRGCEFPLRFVSGVQTSDDVMRGEECELAGLLRLPLWSAAGQGGTTVVLPGTHSKHAHVVDGRLLCFRTFLTGELYALLGTHSVLRHSLANDALLPDPAGVAAGADAVGSDGLSAALFRVRTARLLHGATPAWCRGFLSGALIGAEVSTLASTAPADRIVLCAGAAQAPAYRAALRQCGLDARTLSVPPDEVASLTVRGHAAVLEALDR